MISLTTKTTRSRLPSRREAGRRHRRFQRGAEPAASTIVEPHIDALRNNQLFLSVVTVAELRYGAIVAEWGTPRRARVEAAVATTTVVPVTDALLTRIAEVRAACKHLGHPLADRLHSNDLWIAATALHIDAAVVTADHIFTGVPDLVVLP